MPNSYAWMVREVNGEIAWDDNRPIAVFRLRQDAADYMEYLASVGVGTKMERMPKTWGEIGGDEDER